MKRKAVCLLVLLFGLISGCAKAPAEQTLLPSEFSARVALRTQEGTAQTRSCEILGKIWDSHTAGERFLVFGGIPEHAVPEGPGDLKPDDKAMLEALNALIHPAVWNQMDAAAKILEAEDSEVPVVFDVPLLIESGWHKEMDITILVTCPQDLVIKRVMQRDGASREEVLARMQAQMNQDEKLKFADIVIDNSGTYEALLDQVDRLYQKLLNLAKRG